MGRLLTVKIMMHFNIYYIRKKKRQYAIRL
jgi:hypothetical protein